jgi:hypothetical protein
VHPAELATTTVYVPLADILAFRINSFALLDEKLFGPVHAYVPPPLADKFIVSPEQSEVVDELANAIGVGFTIMLIVAGALVQLFKEAITE